MQIKHLHPSIYKLYRYARTQECLDAYRQHYKTQVDLWEKLTREGVSLSVKQEIVGISRATYYRHKQVLKNLDMGIAPPSKRPKRRNQPQWGESEKQLVLKIRRENPTYGRFKIAIILKRDHGKSISESTVGRILNHLKSKGLVVKSASALRQRRKRNFKNHAQPWTYKPYEDMDLGERIQIDHMTVSKNGITVKHFQSWERRSKHIYAGVFSNANAKSAKRFLRELVEKAPFKIKSIQVDGGSEFMAEFEEACADLNLELLVLPPRKPQYNGGVERANRTLREEFYARNDLLEDSVRGLNAKLSKAVTKYNNYRPHKNLNGLTPMQYINMTYSEAA